MFVLSRIEDVVRLAPDSFSSSTELALTRAINGKFANKVVDGLGLCVCLYDIVGATDGTVKAGDGGAYLNVEFTLVVFRPFRGEVLTGRVAGYDGGGIKVSLGFFDDIHIPPGKLFAGMSYDLAAQGYVWTTDDGEKLDIVVDDTVRFRVDHDRFHDCTPGKKGEAMDPKLAPYSIIGAMDRTGLGVTGWWAE
ncbi:DNA-directed RNA polymerase III complex subunit Rpc25 [Savitreella phatthalungensis]